jgi:hypothetical protein
LALAFLGTVIATTGAACRPPPRVEVPPRVPHLEPAPFEAPELRTPAEIRLPPPVESRAEVDAQEFRQKLAEAGLDVVCGELQTMLDEHRFPSLDEWVGDLSNALFLEGVGASGVSQVFATALARATYDALTTGDTTITVSDVEDVQGDLSCSSLGG